MSDKNRNMNDINDQKMIDRTEQAALDQTAEQQDFSEEIRRRLAAPDSGKPTLEEFKLLVYKDREKRRKKRNALVACIIAAFIVGYLSFDALVPEVGADKNPKETIMTEDGVIIEDGGWGSSVGEENVWKTETWADVMDVKKIHKKLAIPQYVPTEYRFKELVIETIGTGSLTVRYIFVCGENMIEIEQYLPKESLSSISLGDYNKTLETKRGCVYIYETEKKATIQMDDGLLNIWCDLPSKEIINIIEGIKI